MRSYLPLGLRGLMVMSYFLRVCDRSRRDSICFISAFVTAGHVKLMLLHDVRNEEGIRSFFHDVHELYVKVLMNPFYNVSSPISSSLFDARVKVLGRKYF